MMTPTETKAEKAEREAQADAALADAAAGSDVATDDAKGRKVSVPQGDGEIVLSRGADVVLSKTVRDGHVTADNADELAVLLGSVPGAELVD